MFCHDEATLYRVERSRGRRIITETLGDDFAGVLVSDCLNVYDGATPVQHKCYAHHLKAISEACAGAVATGHSVAWLHRVRALLQPDSARDVDPSDTAQSEARDTAGGGGNTGGPDDGAPEDGAPDDGAPDDGAPDDGAPDDGANEGQTE